MESLLKSFEALETIEEARVDAYLKHLELAFEAAKEHELIEEKNVKLQNSIDSLQNEISSLTIHSQSVVEENQALEQKIHNIETDILDTEKKCIELESGLKIKPSDSLRLTKARNMWNIAEKFTGIKWDYSAPDNIVKGYITNKDKKMVEAFEYDKNQYPDEKIVTELWNHIEAMSSGKWKDIKDLCDPNSIIINKENVAINNI